MGPLAYVRGVEASVSLRSELRGRLWSNHFGWQSLFDVGHAPVGEHWTKSRPADQSLTGHPMSFDRLKRTQRRKRLPGHKLKPSRATLFVQNSKPHLSMKPTYFLGIDAAKHKMRATLSNRSEHVLFEKDLSVETTGLRQLLAAIKRQVNDPEQLLVLLEATGLLHLNRSATLTKAGYAVAVINPLIARRLYRVENSIRDNKSDPIDARGLYALGALHGEKLLARYRFALKPEQFALQRLQCVRKALRSSLTNLKKTYVSLLDLQFPELGQLL